MAAVAADSRGGAAHLPEGMALNAGHAASVRRSMPLMPERVGGLIHVAVTARAGRVLVAREIHMMALDARLLAAFPFLMFFVREEDAVAIQIAVDPQLVAAAGLVHRCGLCAAALGREVAEESKTYGRGQYESKRIRSARRNCWNAQPGGIHRVELGEFQRVGVGVSGTLFPYPEPLDHEQEE